MGLRLEFDPPTAPLPTVMADRILIEQVLVNLIRNGMEAMAEGPRRGDALALRFALMPDGLQLEVIDTGPGISPEVAAHLFDPFTSTKTQGMGMGLNICRTILELHKGQLTHAANPGGGAVFSVRLPITQGGAL